MFACDSWRGFFCGYLQAVWRGFSLRRRLASALAAVTRPDTGEDDTFEELDVDEFVFDEVRTQGHVKCAHTTAEMCTPPHVTHPQTLTGIFSERRCWRNSGGCQWLRTRPPEVSL